MPHVTRNLNDPWRAGHWWIVKSSLDILHDTMTGDVKVLPLFFLFFFNQTEPSALWIHFSLCNRGGRTKQWHIKLKEVVDLSICTMAQRSQIKSAVVQTSNHKSSLLPCLQSHLYEIKKNVAGGYWRTTTARDSSNKTHALGGPCVTPLICHYYKKYF